MTPVYWSTLIYSTITLNFEVDFPREECLICSYILCLTLFFWRNSSSLCSEADITPMMLIKWHLSWAISYDGLHDKTCRNVLTQFGRSFHSFSSSSWTDGFNDYECFSHYLRGGFRLELVNLKPAWVWLGWGGSIGSNNSAIDRGVEVRYGFGRIGSFAVPGGGAGSKVWVKNKNIYPEIAICKKR